MDLDTLKNIVPDLLKGTLITVELTFMSLVVGSCIGVIIAMVKLSSNKVVATVGNFYTWIFRGTPLLLQLFLFYYGFPVIGISLTSMQAAVIGLSLNSGAYMGEIIRSGIMAIDKGQFEASKALGFTYFQTMKRIVLPQAFRIVIPPVGNEFIALIKDTSLVSVIAMEELLRKAQLLVSSSGNVVGPYFIAAILYLVMTTLFTSIFSAIEKKLSIY